MRFFGANSRVSEIGHMILARREAARERRRMGRASRAHEFADGASMTDKDVFNLLQQLGGRHYDLRHEYQWHVVRLQRKLEIKDSNTLNLIKKENRTGGVSVDLLMAIDAYEMAFSTLAKRLAEYTVTREHSHNHNI